MRRTGCVREACGDLGMRVSGWYVVEVVVIQASL